MGNLILEVNDLSVRYGAIGVLEHISFSVKKGDIVSVIGPNGSGKTTLFRALSRVLKPASGSVCLLGQDIAHMSYRALARKVAVVSQELFSGWMTVEEYVAMGRIPYFGRFQFTESERDIAVAETYLNMTGVDRFRTKAMSRVSGGERQLAMIARALTQEPDLLLLDEPTSHLDITHQVGILDLVKRLNTEHGITVMMIVHDLNLASEYSNKLILIENGTIYNQGSPDEVLTYNALEEVYRTIVIVEKNPLSKKPYVLLVSEEARRASPK
jgi:iron complex transport system ATP-binding protein